ncbi:MAG: signal peptidase [Pedosphaera sp.]|nr:signal peptidase [Pedosphaera sp.]
MGGQAISNSIPKWFLAVVIGRRPKWTLVRLGVLIIGAYLLYAFVVIPIRVTGISMLPTYQDKKINFINRLAYLRHEPQRGDIVGVIYSGPHVMLMKRVVGLPGESISFNDGVLYIDGKPMDEPYVKYRCDWTTAPILLSAFEYYVVGDNRSMPPDDHTHGAAARRRIVGKVIFGGSS